MGDDDYYFKSLTEALVNAPPKNGSLPQLVEEGPAYRHALVLLFQGDDMAEALNKRRWLRRELAEYFNKMMHGGDKVVTRTPLSGGGIHTGKGDLEGLRYLSVEAKEQNGLHRARNGTNSCVVMQKSGRYHTEKQSSDGQLGDA